MTGPSSSAPSPAADAVGSGVDIEAPAGTIRSAGSLAARILITPIEWYRRWISPALPPSCRFTPSCSAYAVGALREHGAVRGLWLAARRLGKCHPWHAGGYDPVPARRRSGVTRERSQEAREA